MEWYEDVLDAISAPRRAVVQGLGSITGAPNATNSSQLLESWFGANPDSWLTKAGGFVGDLLLDPVTYALPWAAGRGVMGMKKLFPHIDDMKHVPGALLPLGDARQVSGMQGMIDDVMKAGVFDTTAATQPFARTAMEARRTIPMVKDFHRIQDVADAGWTGIGTSPYAPRALNTMNEFGFGRAVPSVHRGANPASIRAVMRTAAEDAHAGAAAEFVPLIDATGAMHPSAYVRLGANRRAAPHELIHGMVSPLTGPAAEKLTPTMRAIRKLNTTDNPFARLLGQLGEEVSAQGVSRNQNPIGSVLMSELYPKAMVDRISKQYLGNAANALTPQQLAHQTWRLNDAIGAMRHAAETTGDARTVLQKGLGAYLSRSPYVDKATNATLDTMDIGSLMRLLMKTKGPLAAAAPFGAYGMMQE